VPNKNLIKKFEKIKAVVPPPQNYVSRAKIFAMSLLALICFCYCFNLYYILNPFRQLYGATSNIF